MTAPIELLGKYLHLARASERRRRPHVTDRLMLLAGITAARLHLSQISTYCRFRILEHNPHHLIRKWDSFQDAEPDEEFLHLLRQIQRRYPFERVEYLLETLGISTENERAVYYSDQEYIVALLDVEQDELDRRFPSL
ncbi:MAG: hypothetical protein ACI9HK_004032 [Pirellulaceae bacterium]|jgi:hypothetical protein